MPPLSMNIEGVPRYSLVSFILNIYLCETAPSEMDGAVILFLCYPIMGQNMGQTVFHKVAEFIFELSAPQNAKKS